jgi:hypothetical protein
VANPMGSPYKRLTTKQFFPIIKDRLTTKIKLTTNFTATVTFDGKTKEYLHYLKIIESPECPCDRTKLQMEREKLISNVANQNKWPVNKRDIVNRHIKHFIQFTNSIDFEKL